ncbi:MAG: hypothetical protein OIN87_00125, partial [Candidatus Methanoperedens sp.]|nr:hypothetical protein [Candidatus Methanoperedens sp.]
LRKGDKLKVEIRNRSINMIPKTIDITTLVGSINGLDKEIINEEIIRDRNDEDERDWLIKESMKKR